jgi:hypothetical protein
VQTPSGQQDAETFDVLNCGMPWASVYWHASDGVPSTFVTSTRCPSASTKARSPTTLATMSERSGSFFSDRKKST